MNEATPWKFLSDSAVQSDDQDKFGVHSAYARVLYQIAATCDTPFSIALYSSWGTGKTSICNIIRQLASLDKNVRYVYLDVWKYSNDPLKRWILLETGRSLTEQGALHEYQLNGRSVQSHLEFEESWEDKDKINLNFRAVSWLGGAVAVCVVVFIAFIIFPSSDSKTWNLLTPFFGVLAAGGVTTLFLEGVVKELFKSLSGLVFERNVKHVSAKPAFSSEKFGEIFRGMVKEATAQEPTGEKKRIIFIFDNMDRCTEAVAVETIGVIKTYLDEPGCVYIVPCDETALMKHITKSYISEDGKESARKYAKEFLNKFFQTTLRLPVAPEFDIETYLDEQLQLARMTDLPVDARDVLVLGYLGQTPRQIKRVLNDLTAYRSLAAQAEKDVLVEPGALTSDLSLLTKMSVISVEWPEFLNLLADDPELWSDLMNKISIGESIERKDVQAELLSFLRATRHVSPDADIRPFIYLKRVKYERNVALAKTVQNLLRTGDASAFLELLTSRSEEERDEIVRISIDLSRSWLETKREVFLKNASSVLLKAASQIRDRRHLELMVLDLLQYLSQGKPEELADVISLQDLFTFTPTLQSNQKFRCLEKFLGIFDPMYPITKNLTLYWKQLLDHQEQLSSQLRARLRGYLEERYQASESECLLMVYETSQVEDKDTSWIAGPVLLKSVVDKTTLSGDDLDRQRVNILLKYQAQIPPFAKESLTNALALSVQGTRTRTLDTQATSAIDLLNRLDLLTFGIQNLDRVATLLVEQVNAHGNFADKAVWLAPLIILREGLSEGVQAQVDSLYSQPLLEPGDPVGLALMLIGIGPRACSLLLDQSQNVQLLHDQAARLEARFNAQQSPSYRDQILNCFPSSVVIANLAIFDETRAWDLALFSKTVLRGVQQNVPIQTLREQTALFVETFLAGKASGFIAVLDSLLEATHQTIELLDESVARALASSCIEVIETDVERYYAELRFLSTKLDSTNRQWLIRDFLERILKPRQPHWIQVLQKIAEDLDTDEAISKEDSLVSELSDYAFEAARVSPGEAESIFLKLVNHAKPELRGQNIDEALDRLLGLEGTGSPTNQMKPYLGLINALSQDLNRGSLEKLEKFCLRMLGPAKSNEEMSIVLECLDECKPTLANGDLSDRLSELASGDGPIAETARKIIGSQLKS